MRVARLLRISRPRFWLYELGTYAVGVAVAYAAIGGGALPVIPLLAFFAYFLFPANLLIYGINDIHDYETDRLNPKKTGYEALVLPAEHRSLYRAILLVTLPFLPFLWGAPFPAALAFAVFLFCAIGYSAPPVRAKARPGLDSLFSAGHYVATGAFGYLLAGGPELALAPIVAGMCWAVAMHAYSAVPDIQADGDAGLATIATRFGARGTLLLCLALYILAAVLAFPYLGALTVLLGAVYTAIMLASLLARSDAALFRLYAAFPVLNALAGMALFFSAVLR